jgi:predicted membrane protein
VTSRLRDVLGLTVGLYLVALGGLLALIALGVLSLFAAIRIRRVSRRLSRAIGHVRSAEAWAVDDAVIRTVFGDIHLDLRDAELPAGETELTLLCWVGAVHVRVPRGVGLDVEAQAFVGTVDVLGVREEGFIRDIHVRSDDFATAERRLRLRLSTVVGELLVVRSER